MVDSFLVYAGLAAAGIGFLSVLRPLPVLRIGTRRAGAGVLLFGIGFVGVGAFWPAPKLRATGNAEALNAVLPEYHFHEVHALRVRASPERIFRAIHEVRPEEIRWLTTLMAIRRLPEKLLAGGRPPEVVPGYHLRSMGRKPEITRKFRTGFAGPGEVTVTGRALEANYQKEESAPAWTAAKILGAYRDALARIGGQEVAREEDLRSTFHLERGSRDVWMEVAVNPEGGSFHLSTVERESHTARKESMLQALLDSGFLLLREIKDRELVVGIVEWMAPGGSGMPPGQPEGFVSFTDPGAVKIAANFRVENSGGGWSKVTTETRILATDRQAKEWFGVYWRLIHPGSAIIRRTWLEAIRRRAEGQADVSTGGVP